MSVDESSYRDRQPISHTILARLPSSDRIRPLWAVVMSLLTTREPTGCVVN